MKLLPLVLALASVAFAAEPLTLVEGGKSTYSICLSSQASPSEKRGAEELRKFLFEMSGAQLPIVADSGKLKGDLILVGRGKLTDKMKLRIDFARLGEEGFALKTSGRRLVIAGGRLRGTMYGVYTFLDKLGCRWFTREVSRIPKTPTIRIAALNEVQTPAFEYREPFFTEAFDKDWAARNRINGASMMLDESTGGKVTYYPFVHSFNQMIPPEQYFRFHPEWFSLIDGARRADHSQLCLTNPELLRESVKNVLEWIRAHPEARIVSVSQNDWTGWCECDNCRRVEQEEGGVHSGPILRFVNAVAAEVEKKYPDKLIDTLAYWYTEDPPTKVRPRPNVRIRLCPIGACESHPYEKCPRNAYFMRNLRNWSKITNQLYIWHYNTNFAHYLLPFPDFDELAADIPMYKRHGVVGLFLEGAYATGGGGENAELRSYVMARQLWDTRTNVDQEVNEFLEAVYGKAAKAMRTYHDWMHQQVRFAPDGRGEHLYIFMHPKAKYLSREFLDRAQEIFRQADAAADNEIIRRRVRQAALSIDYVELMQGREYEVRDGVFAPANINGLKIRFASLWNLIRSYGVVSIRESSNLKQDEEVFYSMLKPYKVATIQNANWRVDVVPELNARVVRMIDKRSGRDALYRVDPGERTYPNSGGLVLSVYPDHHTRKAYDVAWTVAEASAQDRLVLQGTTAQGLKLERTIGFTADGKLLHTETVLTNAGDKPVEAALQTTCRLGAADGEDAVASYRRLDGTAGEKVMIEPEREPVGSENYLDAKRLDGAWRASSHKAGHAWIARFPKDLTNRTWTNWSLRDDMLISFGAWSDAKPLQPGKTLRLEFDYGASPLAP
jgi:hypothetical protein